MTHEQIRRRIAQLEEKLNEPEEKPASYRTKLSDAKKLILRKYIPEYSYGFLQNEISGITGKIFEAKLEAFGIPNDKPMLTLLQENEESEKLYLKIYEGVCAGIRPLVRDLKVMGFTKTRSTPKKSVLIKENEERYSCSECGSSFNFFGDIEKAHTLMSERCPVCKCVFIKQIIEKEDC